MKNLVILSLMLFSLATVAQTPNGFSYQAVIRNSNGELVKNAAIGLQVSILQGSETGTAVYTETQTPMTNSNGLLTTEIGAVNSVAFSAINWSAGPYFLKTETDITGGTNYSITGTSQLHSVPFAKYAAKAGNGLDYPTNPNAGDIVFSNGTNWELLPKGANGQTLRLDDGKPNWAEPGYALPIVTTAAPTDVMVNAATTGGHIIATGFTDITAKGVCWATTQNPTIENDKTNDANGIGTFTSKLKDLQPNTTYYARAYATNGAGTAYGNQVSFKTFQNVVFPTVTTAAAINITENSAASGGNVTATGGAEVTTRGICWSTNQNPTIADNKTEDGDGSGQFESQMTNLEPGIKYFVRAYATNSAGTGYGSQVSLSALKTLPTITTKNITNISAMGGVTGGTIASSGGGTISDKGICWGENENPTLNDNKISNGTGTSAYTSAIITAVPGTMYYVRAYATNELGTVYGLQKSFATLSNVTFYDFESGMKPVGWSGNWSTYNTGFNSNYCLRSTFGQTNDISITLTLENPGQIRFFYRFSDCNCYLETSTSHRTATIQFFIDDVLTYTYTNDYKYSWLEGLADVTSGNHKFRWRFNSEYWYRCDNVGYGYLDYVVITK